MTIDLINFWMAEHGKSDITNPRLIHEMEANINEYIASPRKQGNQDHFRLMMKWKVPAELVQEIIDGLKPE